MRAWWGKWWPRWRSRVKAAGLGVVVGVAATLVVVEWATPTLDVTPVVMQGFAGAVGRFVRAFVLSPGLGALAAVAAAVVAFESSRRVIRSQEVIAAIEDERQREQAGRERAAVLADRRDDRWYRMYDMVQTKADTLSPNAVAVALESLDQRADDDEKTDHVIVLAEYLDGRQTP